jgi:tetratricopeptide (TPR) repeat protein
MRWALLLLSMVLGAPGETARYELRGRLVPGVRASVWLHGATAPFEESTLAGDDGRFRFRNLEAGAYILGAFVPGRGEMRRTIEVGPSQAAGGKRIDLTVELRDAEFESKDTLRRGAMVSAKELTIPDQARHEYAEASKKLVRRDVEGAVAHLQRALEIAPQFADAWNHLGTIAYQTRDFPLAESCFRKALAADPNLFQPLVNLGGVLINLNQLEEALQYNLYAQLNRPGDALANSQLGMTYFYLDKLDLARKYLTEAKRIDPAHFSHPQLILAQIDLRRHDHGAAAGELEEFLQNHPDAPQAAKIKEDIARLRAPSNPVKDFAGTGMARSFSEKPELPPAKDIRIDAAIGSGRHARVLLGRATGGGWTELPLAWYANDGGHYGASLGFGFSADCLACHASSKGDHPAAIGCVSCHGSAVAGKVAQSACLKCHVEASGPISAHQATVAGEDKFELNSAGYRLLQSRCYQASAGKLTCTTCHPPHSFSKTADEYRMVCRGCHATQHGGAALVCTRCHMPKRPADDAPQFMVADHRIQRPL